MIFIKEACLAETSPRQVSLNWNGFILTVQRSLELMGRSEKIAKALLT